MGGGVTVMEGGGVRCEENVRVWVRVSGGGNAWSSSELAAEKVIAIGSARSTE